MVKTTCIGAYPKPDYVDLPDWFNHPDGPDAMDPTERWSDAMNALGNDAQSIISRGVQEVIADQIEAGIDIPTDGEVPRENYIHYHCRHIEGIDFRVLTEVSLRNGAYSARLPTVIGPGIVILTGLSVQAWARFQSRTRNIFRALTGPLTVGNRAL
jgi:5-methyltetrahydropteroyltriglutamate--homocysteine methyltransferase